MLTATADDADPSHPYGLAPSNAGANPNLALPTNHQLSQQVDP
jgi:hypothetical protein